MTWVDRIQDKSKYSKETLARWKADSIRAKKQHSELMKNPHRDLPSTAPARMAYDEKRIDRKEVKSIRKALTKAMKD